MDFTFSNTIPADYTKAIPVISGNDSLQFNGQEYVLQQNNGITVTVFEIKYEYSCSPFKQAEVLDEILAVGHEEYFYLYHLDANRLIFKYKTDGYFGHLYVHNNLFYVADASGISCIDKEGHITWTNNQIAVDGVIISQFDDDKIYGSGELDPPGGWKNFILDIQTGKEIK
jgi:hypothetical protein